MEKSSIRDRRKIARKLVEEWIRFFKVDKVNTLYRESRRKLVEEWMMFLKDMGEKHCLILDVGAGDCYISHHISKFNLKVVAIDVDKERLVRGYNQHEFKVKRVIANGVELPFKNESFDGVVCLEVIEHVYSPITLLEEIFRVLKPGSYFLLTTPNGDRPIRKILKIFGINLLTNPTHVTEFTFTEISTMLRETNFEITKLLGYALDIPTPILRLVPWSLLQYIVGPTALVKLSKHLVVMARKPC